MAERSKAYHVKGIRMQPMECTALDRACDALDLDRASFMSEAALFEATRLGIRYSVEPVEPLRKTWPYLPDRHDEPTGVRISTTITRTLSELVGRAADHVHATEPMFLVGATLAYIGRLQKTFQGTSEDTPEDAVAIKKKLAAIKIPPQYQYRAAKK